MEAPIENPIGEKIVNGLIKANNLTKYDVDLDTALYAFDIAGEHSFITSIREMIENAK